MPRAVPRNAVRSVAAGQCHFPTASESYLLDPTQFGEVRIHRFDLDAVMPCTGSN